MNAPRHRIVIDSAFQLGELVCLRADQDADTRGMITGLLLRPHGVIYQVTWNIHTEQPHYEIELLPVADNAAAEK